MQKGGYLLACTHLSHLEPLCASVLCRRRIDWITRIEFYRWKPAAIFFRAIDTIPVNRQGVPVKMIRTAVERAKSGRVVGVFPEGGVSVGAESVCRGGAIRKGVCLIANRANVPIVPCVMLGTEKLNSVGPWLPVKRGDLWAIFGEPIAPRPEAQGPAGARHRREDREAMAVELQGRFAAMYDELRNRHGIRDEDVP